MIGAKTWMSFVMGYMLPTLAGNIIGGVSLVSSLNHAQVIAGSARNGKSSRETILKR
jgi:formate/nitrite transporter FocA (FNT family)